jgi:hypothetical protein
VQDIRHAVTQFAQSLGLESFSMGADSSARIILKNGEILGFEALDNTLMISRVFPTPFISEQLLIGILRMANARNNLTPTAIHVGLRGSGREASIVVSHRIERLNPSPSEIAQSVSGIQAWFHQWQSLAR